MRLRELLEHPLGGMRIEIAGRFIGEEQLRARWRRRGQSPRAAARRRRAVLDDGRRALRGPRERSNCLARSSASAVAGQPKNELRQHRIFERREFRQEMVKLIDEADSARRIRVRSLSRELDAIDAIDHHGAGVGPFEQASDMEQE